MSGYNKEKIKKEDIFTNNSFQNKNNINIQHLLSYYKKYELKEELLYFEEDSIISKESQKPDLFEINYVFNKNICFYNANLNENNPFPRTILSLKLSTSSSDSKEENSGNSDGTSSSKKSEDNSSDKSAESEDSSDCEELECENCQNDEQQQTNNSCNNENDVITSEEIFKNLNNMDIESMNSLVIGGNDTPKQEKAKKHDYFNFLDYMQEKGWKISINGRVTLHQYFTTPEVFEMLTDAIEQNTSLDSLIIYDEKYKKHFQGGGMYFALKIFIEKYIEAKRIHSAHLYLLRNMTHKNFNHGIINNNYCQNQNNYEQYNNDKINLFINGQKVHVNNNFNFGVNG